MGLTTLLAILALAVAALIGTIGWLLVERDSLKQSLESTRSLLRSALEANERNLLNGLEMVIRVRQLAKAAPPDMELVDIIEKARQLLPEQALAISVEAGIHNPDGTLTAAYGGAQGQNKAP